MTIGFLYRVGSQICAEKKIDKTYLDFCMGGCPETAFSSSARFLGRMPNKSASPWGAGAIINISSIYGLKPSDAGHAAYCASKFGVIGLSKTAAVDYGQHGLRINVVTPGVTVSGTSTPRRRAPPKSTGPWRQSTRR